LAPLERFPEQARGVGQLEATVERFIPCRPADCDGVGLLCRFSLALALGVGHADDEEAFALMACADFLRRKESFRNPVTQAFQLASDFPITEVEMIGDVFQENKSGLTFSNDAGDMRPEMAGVVNAPALASDAKWLTRITSADEIHRAAPSSAIVAGKVVPDNSLIQGRFFHPGHEDGRGIGVPFDITHSAISGFGDGKSEIEPSGTRAQRQAEQGPSCPFARTAGGM
jgi:hypothetical protein